MLDFHWHCCFVQPTTDSYYPIIHNSVKLIEWTPFKNSFTAISQQRNFIFEPLLLLILNDSLSALVLSSGIKICSLSVALNLFISLSTSCFHLSKLCSLRLAAAHSSFLFCLNNVRVSLTLRSQQTDVLSLVQDEK